MEIKIGVSARHVHLTKEDFLYLYGDGCSLTKAKDLSQIGEYACKEVVNLITPKATIEDVRILGPYREYTQVEISKTDSYELGLNPPVRESGDLKGAELITIEYNGKKLTKNCCIIADRHIHINNHDIDRYDLSDGQVVKIKLSGEKGGIIDNVKVKSDDLYVLEAHIDLDDANAHLVKTGDLGEIIYE